MENKDKYPSLETLCCMNERITSKLDYLSAQKSNGIYATLSGESQLCADIDSGIERLILEGYTKQDGTPSPSSPVSITGAQGYDALEWQYGNPVYSRSDDYDPTADQYYAIHIICNGYSQYIGTTKKIPPLFEGDSINFGTGEVIRSNEYIRSYNGEEISDSDTWKSSMDVYSEGSTPTTGAQVVIYKYSYYSEYTTDITADLHKIEVSVDTGFYSKETCFYADGTIHLSCTSALTPVQKQDGDYYLKSTVDGYNRAYDWVEPKKVLLSSVSSTDTAPYIFRATAGDGVRCDEKLVGGSIGWNQLVRNGNFAENSNWSAYSGGNATYAHGDGYGENTINSIPEQPYFVMMENDNAPDAVVGHKYLYTADVSPSKTMSFQVFNSNGGTAAVASCAANTWTRISGVNQASRTIMYMSIQPRYNFEIEVGVKFKVRNAMNIDLTAMFGTTIADAIYSAESSTTGAGVEMVKALGILDSYHAYNAGELMSVNVGSKVLTGFNAWDEEWEIGTIDGTTGANTTNTTRIRCKNYIPVIPETQYFLKCGDYGSSTIRTRYYDKSKNYIGATDYNGSTNGANNVRKMPSNCCYFRFDLDSAYGTTYNHDICINISDTAKNGTYEPYTAQTVTYDDITLRGVPKISDGSIYYDGDTYESDGTVTRRYGVVDLGTLTWTKVTASSSRARFRTTALESVAKKPSSNSTTANVSCVFEAVAYSTGNSGAGVKVCALDTDADFSVWVADSAYADAATFKSAMSGVYLVYELATPTTETASAYTNPQTCDPDGTEVFIDASVWAGRRDVSVPVGHVTNYYASHEATIEDVFSAAPTGDDTYMLTVYTEKNKPVFEWVKAPALNIPDPPSSGRYDLNVSSNNGVVTYNWLASPQ